MAMSWPDKDPREVLDYVVDWATAPDPTDADPSPIPVLQDGETLTSSTHTISGPDSVLHLDSENNDTTKTKAWLSAGTSGKAYVIEVTVQTTMNRTYARSIHLKVKDL
jgi:hypothetical protein